MNISVTNNNFEFINIKQLINFKANSVEVKVLVWISSFCILLTNIAIMKYDYNKLWLELVSSSNECIVQSLSCRLGESLWSPLKFSLKKRLHLPLRYGIGIAWVNIFKFKCKPTQTDLDPDLSLTLNLTYVFCNSGKTSQQLHGQEGSAE